MTKTLYSTLIAHRALIGFVTALLLSLASQAQTIRYVKPDNGRTTKNGLSWATAYDQNQLQQAINDADASSGSDKQVWVAQGIYKPTTSTARNVSFGMRDNVAIYGGFAATGSPTMTSRNPDSYTTILSGEIGNPNSNEDNSYAVILNGFYSNAYKAVGQTAILDGFTITGGNAKGSYADYQTFGGAGMNNSGSSPTVRNCRFTGNTIGTPYGDIDENALWGGAMLNVESSPTLINCRFDHNFAVRGGAIACIAFPGYSPSNPTLINCRFETNTGFDGGAVYNYSGSGTQGAGNKIQLINCRFTGNGLGGFGGAVCSESYGDLGNQITLTNCSLVDNLGYGGGAIANFSTALSIQLTNCSLLNNKTQYVAADILNDTNFPNSNPDGPPITRLTNCIVWGGSSSFEDGSNEGSHSKHFTSVSYSLLQSDIDNYVDEGNNIKSRVFPYLSTTDLRLSSCSLAINAGLNSATGLTGIITDLAGNPRFYNNGQVDMGAYELQAAPIPTVAITTPPPSGTSVLAGATVTASVSVTGTSPAYQWYKDGQVLTGVVSATTATLTLTNVTPSAAGSYSVVVTGSCNSVTSTAFSLSVTQSVQAIRYVKAGGSGNANGTSWTNAASDLPSQINAPGVTQVWVAQGTYKPGTERTSSFSLKNGVSILGGFPSTGTPILTDRNPASYTTILSGDIGQVGDNTDNVYQVIVNTNSDLDGTALLDGFVITGGNINASGGGVRIENGSPRLANCTITGNMAYQGGGLYTSYSSLTLINCSISGNTAENGGGIYTSRGTVVLINGLISDNTATGNGGGILTNSNGDIRLLNVTLSSNSAVRGGAIFNQLSNPSLINCIDYSNGGANTFATGIVSSNHAISASYSLIESTATGYTSGPGNLTATSSPFASPGSFQLRAGSPALNAGSNSAYTNANGPAIDLGGNLRIQKGTIDMGAYESGFSSVSDLIPILYARPSLAYGSTDLSVVVDVLEINSIPTSGTVTVKINKNTHLTLSLPGSLTSLNGHSVQNGDWSFSDLDANYYVLSTTQVVSGGNKLSVGLVGKLQPGATSGGMTVSAVVVGGSGGEVNGSNNADADRIDYFQQ